MISIQITKDNFQAVRENGIGSNFSVLNPKDGFRKDNRLWFGTCSECGEQVSNSALTGKGWVHTISTTITYHADGVTPCQRSSKQFTYCPKVGG